MKKLVYIPNCWRCSFPRAVVFFFTFLPNTHSHVHQHRQYSPTHFLFQSFSYISMHFFLCRSSTRWWWNGYTVWFGRLCVILIFYVCYSLLLADVAGGELLAKTGGWKCILFMCGFFSMMVFRVETETNVHASRRIGFPKLFFRASEDTSTPAPTSTTLIHHLWKTTV